MKNRFFIESAFAYIRNVPISLAIRELNRLLAFKDIKKNYGLTNLNPILDVGCGDGFWWQLQPEHGRDNIFGIDISDTLVKEANKYINAELCDISKDWPFKNRDFPLIVGNCSLEHVEDISTALTNIHKSATQKSCTLILIVPTVHWAYQGYTQQFLLRKFPRIAMAISGLLNGFFQHWHLYDYSVWEIVLQKTGWRVIDGFGLGNKKSEFLFRLFLPFAFIGFIFKSIIGFYPNKLFKIVPKFLLQPIIILMEWALKNPIVDKNDSSAYELIIVAEKNVTS
tara:strand:- start:1424 stop:2269 length:846 start_codon:yes stop_codon:yes gene_type:complete